MNRQNLKHWLILTASNRRLPPSSRGAIKSREITTVIEADNAGLGRYLEASAGLSAALKRNVDRVTEPALRHRLTEAIETLAKRGEGAAPKGRRGHRRRRPSNKKT